MGWPQLSARQWILVAIFFALVYAAGFHRGYNKPFDAQSDAMIQSPKSDAATIQIRFNEPNEHKPRNTHAHQLRAST